MMEPKKTKLLAETREKCPDLVGEGFDPGKAQAEGHKGILIAEAGGPEPVYGGRENDLWMGRH